jgi:hypothetical protein
LQSHPRVRKILSLLILLAPAVAACTSVHSNLTINGGSFGPDECRNLADEELYGVDLHAENGSVLRLAHNVDDSVDVVVINGVDKPIAMTGCATLSLDRSSDDKYGNYQVSGRADIDCDTQEFHVHGTTNFNDCDHEY